MSKNSPLPAAYRWRVASRSVAAIFGGYALAAAWAACMSLWLQQTGMARVDAVTTATMSSFLVHLCAAIWVFAVADTRRAWLGVALPAALLAAGTWLAKGVA
ncbi:DUF3649 domain-containing protein [Massilia sp. METH4]|uniref:DUF3649 domain-containing protein n=1 Tax=Massilia sp. METH4 TaxID=3123041 RepID=UPI0030CD136E